MSRVGGPGQPRRVVRAWRRAAAGAGTVLLAAAALSVGAGAAAAKPGAPALTFSPAPFDYGQVTTGQTASQTFTLANTGTKATGKLRVTLTGSGAFTVTGGTCGAKGLKPGATCTVVVQFAPASTGTATATLAAAGKKQAVTAADVLTGTGALGQSSGQLFWAAAVVSQGAIWAANLDGTGAHPIVIGQQDQAGVAANASNIYWAGGSQGTISKANLDGTGATQIVTGQNEPIGIAVGTSHIFWTTSDGSIWEADLDGMGATPIVTGQTRLFGVAASAETTECCLYWASRGNTQPGAGSIWKANLDGTGARQIVIGQFLPSGVAVSTSHLYWIGTGDGTVNRANLDGTGATAIVTQAPSLGAIGVAVSTDHVYWTNELDGSIWEANPDGTGARSIVTEQTDPVGIAVTT
jgi:hypothetical protein